MTTEELGSLEAELIPGEKVPGSGMFRDGTKWRSWRGGFLGFLI